jgi:hypothetical protein
MAPKKRYDNNFFSPLSFIAVFDPGLEIRDPGWIKIRIRDKHPRIRNTGTSESD